MSVERRVEDIENLNELPETCHLYWNNSNLTATNNAPTNYPTKNMTIHVTCSNGVYRFVLPTFSPSAETTIEFDFNFGLSSTNRVYFFETLYQVFNVSTTPGRRNMIFKYDPVARAWCANMMTPTKEQWFYEANGDNVDCPDVAPATVEEWLERYQPMD